MAKKKRQNPFKRKDKDGNEVWKTKELLQSGAALAALAGGTDHASKFVSPFDEQDTNGAGGTRETNPDKKKPKPGKPKTGYNVEQGI